MTKITGKYYTDGNFVNVCTDNTLYTIARNTGDWGCRKVGDKTGFGIFDSEAYKAELEQCTKTGTFELK